MPETIKINQRGTLTLPASVRKHFRLKTDDLLIVESTPQGILLRPAQAIPIQLFDEADLEEMTQMEKELESMLTPSDGSNASSGYA